MPKRKKSRLHYFTDEKNANNLNISASSDQHTEPEYEPELAEINFPIIDPISDRVCKKKKISGNGLK